MQNFWEIEGWENEDHHLSRIKKLPFQRPFPSVSWGEGLFSIRGPRQIGKTCWIKSILLEKTRQEAKNCFYLSCENLRDHQDLAELLKSVRNRSWIFLDEITFVKDWARAVKHEADAGYVKTLVVTGSDAHDLRQGQERMPGRLRRSAELELLPMSFLEFQAMRRIASWPKLFREEELELFFRIGGSRLRRPGRRDGGLSRRSTSCKNGWQATLPGPENRNSTFAKFSWRWASPLPLPSVFKN